jgi:fructosamine-3-kinase
VAPRAIADAAGFAVRFGHALAALHRDNPSPDGTFGLESNNFIGALPQPNAPRTRDWPAFYRDCRLLPQIALARQLGRLSPEREAALMSVVERLPLLLGDFDARPVLLHGDLWSGNFLVAHGDEPVVIDPAVYYGEREAEIAFVELFGGFPDGLLPAYRAACPLDAGYERRRALHQLYPLLVHLNLFGEGYGPRVDAVCRRYAVS